MNSAHRPPSHPKTFNLKVESDHIKEKTFEKNQIFLKIQKKNQKIEKIEKKNRKKFKKKLKKIQFFFTFLFFYVKP